LNFDHWINLHLRACLQPVQRHSKLKQCIGQNLSIIPTMLVPVMTPHPSNATNKSLQAIEDLYSSGSESRVPATPEKELEEYARSAIQAQAPSFTQSGQKEES
jgi:hypothetical protein